VLGLPALAAADRVGSLQAANARIAAEHRSAVLDLYSLDTRLARAQAQLAALRAREAALESQRASLKLQLHLAHYDAALSQRRLATRIRFLYDHGTTSTLELLFGARSLEDALSEMDNFDRVTAVNDDVLHELRADQVRLGRLTRSLTRKQLALDADAAQAEAVAGQLAQARASRASYVAGLESQQTANVSAIAALEQQAQAAVVKAQQQPAPVLTPVALATAAVTPVAANGARTLTVSATGYSLPGNTASGLPVGWGIVAVDPSVIPLGTHLMIPGYGEAVAADTGSAVVGDTIDLWFPSTAQAMAWGRRSVTVALH
jgi:3D (Asp-Asp-Asp) domain-containing protein